MNPEPVSYWTTASPYIVALIAAVTAYVAARISHSAKISEFRQAWINELRKDVADFVGAAERWFRLWEQTNLASGDEEVKLESEKLFPAANEARVILWRIRMRLNPRENSFKVQDDRFLQSLLHLLNPGKIAPPNLQVSWLALADDAVEQGRELFKREWEVTKTLSFTRWLDSLFHSAADQKGDRQPR